MTKQKQQQQQQQQQDNVERRRQMTKKEKKRVVRLHKDGKTLGYIAKKLGRSKPTIQKLLAFYEAGGKSLVLMPRKRKLSTSERRHIIALVQRTPNIRANSIRDELGLTHVSIDTIRLLLRDEGYGCGNMRKTPCRGGGGGDDDDD